MMKFGRQLRFLSLHKWSDKYIRYERLKRRIYQVAGAVRDNEGDVIEELEEEVAFRDSVQADLRKVNEFATSTYDALSQEIRKFELVTVAKETTNPEYDDDEDDEDAAAVAVVTTSVLDESGSDSEEENARDDSSLVGKNSLLHRNRSPSHSGSNEGSKPERDRSDSVPGDSGLGSIGGAHGISTTAPSSSSTSSTSSTLATTTTTTTTSATTSGHPLESSTSVEAEMSSWIKREASFEASSHLSEPREETVTTPESVGSASSLSLAPAAVAPENEETITLELVSSLRKLCVEFVQFRQFVFLNKIGFRKIFRKHLRFTNSTGLDTMDFEGFVSRQPFAVLDIQSLGQRLSRVRDYVKANGPSDVVRTELFSQLLEIRLLTPLEGEESVSLISTFRNEVAPLVNSLFMKVAHSFMKIFSLAIIAAYLSQSASDGAYAERLISVGILFGFLTLVRAAAVVFAHSGTASSARLVGFLSAACRAAVFGFLVFQPRFWSWSTAFILSISESFFDALLVQLAQRLLWGNNVSDEESVRVYGTIFGEKALPVPSSTPILSKEQYGIGAGIAILLGVIISYASSWFDFRIRYVFSLCGAVVAVVQALLFVISSDQSKYREGVASSMAASKYSPSTYFLSPIAVLLQQHSIRWVVLVVAAAQFSSTSQSHLSAVAVIVMGLRVGEMLGRISFYSKAWRFSVASIALLGAFGSVLMAFAVLLSSPKACSLDFISFLEPLCLWDVERVYVLAVVLAAVSFVNLFARLFSSPRRGSSTSSASSSDRASYRLFVVSSESEFAVARLWLFKTVKTLMPVVAGVLAKNPINLALALVAIGAVTLVMARLSSQIGPQKIRRAEEREMSELGFKKRGAFIVVEGLDGSGKSTQLKLLDQKLRMMGYDVVLTGWNSSSMFSMPIKYAKRLRRMRRRTFALSQAADLSEQLYDLILPALSAGKIVLCDRYFYTALARDSVRGSDREWLESLFSYLLRPDLVLYFRIPVETAIGRVLARRVRSNGSTSDNENDSDDDEGLVDLSQLGADKNQVVILPALQPICSETKQIGEQAEVEEPLGSSAGEKVEQQHEEGPELNYYEAGLDLHLSEDALENFVLFQTSVSRQYDIMATEFDFRVIDASQDMEIQQSEVMNHVTRMFLSMPTIKPAPHNILDRDPFSDDPESRENYLKSNIPSSSHFFFRHSLKSMITRFEELIDDQGLAPMPVVFLHGNPHISNFSKGPHGTAMVDFDRSRLGPYGWDVVRLLISMSIAAKQQTSYVLPSATLWAMLESYMWGFRNPNLPVRPMDKLLYTATQQDNMTTTDYVAAGRSWASELFKNPLSIDHPAIRKLMEDFKKTIPEPSVLDGYTIERAGYGTGSFGKRRYLVVLNPENEDDSRDRIFLDMKETYSDSDTKYFVNPIRHEGERMVIASKLYAPWWSLLEGFGEYNDQYFYIRQIPPVNVKLKVPVSVNDLHSFGESVCQQLGRAHRLSVQPPWHPRMIMKHLQEHFTDFVNIAATLRSEVMSAFYRYRINAEAKVLPEAEPDIDVVLH